MALVTKSQFRQNFAKRIQSADFGCRRAPEIGITIQRLRLGRVLSQKQVVTGIYRLGRRHHLLELSRPKAMELNRQLRAVKLGLHNAQQTLRSAEKKVDAADSGCQQWLNDSERAHLYQIKTQIHDFILHLDDRQHDLVSSIPPALRKKKDIASRWSHIIHLYEYDLPRLVQRATDHWLIEQIYALLTRAFERANHNDVPQTTRCGIVAGILEDLGLGWVEPTTISMQLRRKHLL